MVNVFPWVANQLDEPDPFVATRVNAPAAPAEIVILRIADVPSELIVAELITI